MSLSQHVVVLCECHCLNASVQISLPKHISLNVIVSTCRCLTSSLVKHGIACIGRRSRARCMSVCEFACKVNLCTVVCVTERK